MNVTEIRRRFVDFYTQRDFHLLPRAPMLHPSIPMSFVMSAGLVQVETSLAHADNRDGDKFVLVQECFRHFDLDRIGTDDLHLSLFEMPGAFVFGPNGKEATIQRMWTLATRVLGVDKNRLWASYFKGGDVLDQYVPADKTTRQVWIDLGLPKNRVVGLGPDDNYWVQGGGINGRESARKAGPNTELFFDRGIEKACSNHCQPGCKCGRFIEFSNSLFICHQQDQSKRTLRPMDEPFAETVIGSERVAMILQEVASVFDTDQYRPLIEQIDSFVTKPKVNGSQTMESKRVIADHLKALYVLVKDGAPPPGKNGRERIIKLLIRGVVTRQLLLNIQSRDYLPALLKTIARLTNDRDHSSSEVQHRVMTYYANEAERFHKTIQRGQHKLERFLEGNDGETLSGSQILFLEKRKGLPHHLTAMMLRERELMFSKSGYKEALEEWYRQAHN